MAGLRRKGLAFLGAAGLLACLAAWMFSREVRAWEAGVSEIRVVAAATAIPPLTQLRPEHLTAAPLAARYLHPALFTDASQLVGRVTVGPIAAGEWVSASMVRNPDGLQADQRVLVLAGGPVLRIDGWLAVGDRVDVFASFREGEREVTRLLMAAVPVVGVSEGEPRSVSLMVSLDQARDLIWQENYGQQVRLIRRPVRA